MKTYILKNPKNKNATDILIDANTGEADLAAFEALGYDVATARKQIAADKNPAAN